MCRGFEGFDGVEDSGVGISGDGEESGGVGQRKGRYLTHM